MFQPYPADLVEMWQVSPLVNKVANDAADSDRSGWRRRRRVPVISFVGKTILLRPLLPTDGCALVQAAADGDLWNLPFTVVPSAETVESYIGTALEGRAAGTVMPLVIEILESKQVVGTTRFWKIDLKNRKLEIGHTWISASWQRTCVNTEAKFLMLCYAFEQLNCVRVQFTTDEINERSRKAILRLGAKQEGIIRHERILPDGRKRNSVRFSIIDDEWTEVRRVLESRLFAYHRPELCVGWSSAQEESP
jgi:N-acetyltransferase